MLPTRRRCFQVVKLYLENGADPSPKCEGGLTPLHAAVSNGDVDMVDLLLFRKADVDAKENICGTTPLHIAATAGYRLIVSLLLRAHADTNVLTEQGESPLHMASLHGRTVVVRMLLDHEANPQLVCDGCVALEVAVTNGHSGVVEQFGKTLGFEVCGGTTKGEFSLRLAAQVQNAEILQMLLLGGVKDVHGHALCKSLSVGDEECTKILLSASENPKDYVNEARLGTHNLSTLECCMMPSSLRLTSGRIVRRLLNAGMCSNDVGGEFLISCASSLIKNYYDSNCVKNALGLTQILRLVLQEPAIHALSWGWPTRAEKRKLQSEVSVKVRLQRATKKKFVTVLLAGLARKKTENTEF